MAQGDNLHLIIDCGASSHGAKIDVGNVPPEEPWPLSTVEDIASRFRVGIVVLVKRELVSVLIIEHDLARITSHKRGQHEIPIVIAGNYRKCSTFWCPSFYVSRPTSKSYIIWDGVLDYEVLLVNDIAVWRISDGLNYGLVAAGNLIEYYNRSTVGIHEEIVASCWRKSGDITSCPVCAGNLVRNAK